MFGVVGNILVLRTITKFKKRLSVVNIMFMNLALADLIMCLVSPPILLTITWYQGYYSHWTILCNLNGVFYIFNLHVNGWTLMAIALHRCWVISHPLTTKHLSRQMTVLFFVLVWMIALAVSIGAYLYWIYFPEACGTVSILVTHQFKVMTGFVSIIMVVSYSVLLFSFKKSNQVTTLHEKHMLQVKNAKKRLEVQSTKTCMIVICCYLASMIPTVTVSSLAHDMETGQNQKKNDLLIIALSANLFQNYINPFIYCLRSRQFRKRVESSTPNNHELQRF